MDTQQDAITPGISYGHIVEKITQSTVFQSI